MTMMRNLGTLIAAALAACYSPSPQPGSPCVDDSNCPSPLVCSNERCSASDDPGPRPDSCVPMAEICDNGIDDDCSGGDQSCGANDKPAGAVDVTNGGVFSGDAAAATDDVSASGCGLTGGRDLFYSVDLLAPRVYYFDTFGSAYDTVIRVYAKACDQVGAGAGAVACIDDACGGSQSQVAVSLPIGKSCIVVDQRDPAAPAGALTLQVLRATQLGAGKPLATGVQATPGPSTCNGATSTFDPPAVCGPDGGGSNGRDHMYFFTACPGQTLRIDADTCGAGWDSVIHAWTYRAEPRACDDDDDTNNEACGPASKFTNISLGTSPLYLLYVDGFEPSDCGAYTLRTNIR